MPSNVEIKAACANLAIARQRAIDAGAVVQPTLEQTDRYFELDGRRRVKLRTFGGGGAELIEYERPEEEGVRVSHYQVMPVRDDGVCAVPKGPPLVVVRKRRQVLLLENVRIHLDEVEGLGTFLELEAVVDAVHDEGRCRGQVDELLDLLGIAPDHLIRASYSELLLAAAR